MSKKRGRKPRVEIDIQIPLTANIKIEVVDESYEQNSTSGPIAIEPIKQEVIHPDLSLVKQEPDESFGSTVLPIPCIKTEDNPGIEKKRGRKRKSETTPTKAKKPVKNKSKLDVNQNESDSNNLAEPTCPPIKKIRLVSNKHQEKEKSQSPKGKSKKKCDLPKTPTKKTKKNDKTKPPTLLDRGCIIHIENIEKSKDLHKAIRKNYRKRVKALIPQDKRFPVGNYKCHSCYTNFTQLVEWEDHMILYLQHKGCFPFCPSTGYNCVEGWTLLDDKNYKCNDCTFLTKHKQDVFQHIIAKHKPLALRCGICTKTFTTLPYLKKHLSYKHDPTRAYLSCSLCDYKTIDKYSLEIHNRIKHTGEGYLKCQFCDYKTITNYKLKNHIANSHNKDNNNKKKKYKCIHCVYSSFSQARLDDHVALKHSDVADIYHCAYCSYNSKSKMYLEVHIFKMHMQDKVVMKYKCVKCFKMFPTQSGLSTHMRIIHSKGLEVFPCNYCEMIFPAKYELFMHNNINHLLHPEFQCNECSFRAKTDEELRVHVYKHHRLKFYCHYCPFETHLKLNIYCHINNKHNPHSKRHKCLECNYKSKNRCLLLQHINVKHNPNAIHYECHYCGYKNKIKHKMAQHMQTKHKDLLKPKKVIKMEIAPDESLKVKPKIKNNKSFKAVEVVGKAKRTQSKLTSIVKMRNKKSKVINDNSNDLFKLKSNSLTKLDIEMIVNEMFS